MRPSKFGATIALAVLYPVCVLKAEPLECTGPSELPAAGISAPYCHNGRMGFAATEYAPISQAANIPNLRAFDFAKQEAELKARGALAKFLNDSSMWETAIRSSNMVDSSERQAWLALVSNTQVQTVRARLAAGVRVVATDAREGAVFVTVATSPDMKDMASSISNYRPRSQGGSSAEGPQIRDDRGVNPFTVVPQNVAPDLK